MVDLFNKHRNGINFEPSDSTKELWLITRKSSYQPAAIYFPGLFNVTKVHIDQSSFFLAIFFEILGLIFILIKVKSPILAISLGIVLFLFDIILAFISHKPQKIINLNQNKLIIENDQNKKIILKQEINKAKFKSRLGYFGIIIIAISKFLIFTAAWGFKFNALTLLIILSYIIVAYIHINNSGYFFSNISLSRNLKRDFDNYLHNSTNSIVTHYIETFKTPIELTPAQAGNQSLILESDSYIIKSWGILYDNEIQTLLNMQKNSQAKDELGKHCLKLQLRILNSNPLIDNDKSN